MARLGSPPTSTGQSSAVSGRVVVVFAVVLLMPFPVILHDFTRNHHEIFYDYSTLVFPVDVALLGLALVVWPAMLADVRRKDVDVGWAGWASLCLILVVSLVAHPTSRGLLVVIEMFGAAAVAYTLARAEPGRERNTVIFAVGGIGVMEALWAIGQRLQNGPLGLQRFGESSDPFYRAFGTPAPQGSMVHIYVLAGLGLLAGAFLIWAASEMARPRVWLVAAAIAISSVGFTYSRAGALGLLLLVGAVVVAGYPPLRRRSLAMTAALVIGAGVPALIWSGGWTTRASQTTSAATSAALTTDRGHLLGQAVHIIEHNPILGVGPGRYATAVRDRFGSRPINYRAVFQPVHNIPTLAAAEGGVLAGVVVAATFIALGWRALRSGALPTAVFLCYLPFFMLDQFAYAFPQGIVMTGLWLGAVDALTRRPAALSAGH